MQVTGSPTSPSRVRADPRKGVRQDSLRTHNLGLVLRTILGSPEPPSRADVAAATGLTRATVSTLVDQLVAAKLVVELAPAAPQRVGRPPVPLTAARGTVAAVGMEMNVDYMGARAIDLTGEVLAEHIETGDFRNSDPAPVLGRLADIGGRIITQLAGNGVRICGTVVALPGLVDSATGPLRIAPNLGWRDVDVVALIAQHPVIGSHPPMLDNEASLAARAEVDARRPGGLSSFVYVSGEVGIGGAIVLDGRTFPGRHGWSAEIGQIPVGTLGSFGDGGTMEQLAGQDAICDAAGLPRTTSAAEVAADMSPAVTAALERAGDALGVGLAAIVNIVDLDRVVLGGIFGPLVGRIGERIEAQLAHRVISAPWTKVRVEAAVAGAFPAMTGGALLALSQVLDDPGAWADAV